MTADELLARLDEPAPITIRLDPGESFCGRYIGLESRQSDYGPRWVAVFTSPDDDSQRFALWLMHAALTSQLKRCKPQRGDLIAVKRLGTRRGASGRNYEDWAAVSERESAFDWSDVEDPEEG